MDWRGPIKPTYIELPRDLVLEVKAIAARRGTTIKAAVQEALEAWLNPKLEQPTDGDPDVEMLREFKQIGEPHYIEALHQNIVVFLHNARRGGHPKKKRA